MGRSAVRPRSPHTKDRLLRRLIAAEGRIVSDEACLFAMYGAAGMQPPSSAIRTLRTIAVRLRDQLPIGALIHVRHQGYRLDPDAVPAFLLEDVDHAQVMLARTTADLDAFTAMRRAARERRWNARRIAP